MLLVGCGGWAAYFNLFVVAPVLDVSGDVVMFKRDAVGYQVFVNELD